jgi:hypothetical protein
LNSRLICTSVGDEFPPPRKTRFQGMSYAVGAADWLAHLVLESVQLG